MSAVHTPAPAARQRHAVLISPYELGRQPFALAEPAAWLRCDGWQVTLIDLSLQKLDPAALAGADLVGIYLGMHTATRIAVAALPRIRELAPRAHRAAYGLYAPMNAPLLASLGVHTILGGEAEPALRALARRLQDGEAVPADPNPQVYLGGVDFLLPERSGLPALERYARLLLPDGSSRTVGFVEASRGCKHLCRHCPVVPVYQGRFRAVPADVVLADIRQQVAAGARHISFGDPDFLNGPTHALRLARALHREFPGVSFDATIKVQHLIRHATLLPELAGAGCLFITSAVEAVDDRVLEYLDKNHTAADFDTAVILLRNAGIAFAPTFVAFTPWTTLDAYIALLRKLAELKLVESVPPVQLSIRLLVPEGSYLLRLEGFRQRVGEFDPAILGYSWRNPDPRVDELQRRVQDCVSGAEQGGGSRLEVFQAIWRLAHQAARRDAPALPADCAGVAVPRLSEPWYCCAEPTHQQLAAF